MRRFTQLSCIVIALCAVAPAQAADVLLKQPQHVVLPRGHAGKRIAPIVVYDYQPGIAVRAYWHAPWRNRHYFPSTGALPEIGRVEDLTAPRERHQPAESFKREWSTSRVFIEDEPDADAEAPPGEAFPLLQNRRRPPQLDIPPPPPPGPVKP